MSSGLSEILTVAHVCMRRGSGLPLSFDLWPANPKAHHVCAFLETPPWPFLGCFGLQSGDGSSALCSRTTNVATISDTSNRPPNDIGNSGPRLFLFSPNGPGTQL